jgi:hypothetical protein
MTHIVTIYNNKRLIISGLILIVLLIPLNTFIALFLLKSPLIGGIGFVLIIPLILIVGPRLSRKVSEISLDDSYIRFDNTNILLADITGYYINKESLSMIQIEFRDINNNNFSLTSVNSGQKGKDFELFLSEFVKKIQASNNDLIQLSYYDFHDKQYVFFKVFIYVVFIVVVLLNLIYFYLIIFKHVPFNWKLLFVNSLLFWLYDFHVKNEKKYRNKKTTANTRS